METTPYYARYVESKHPGIKDEWIEQVLANPYRSEQQDDGRMRYYGYIEEAGKWLRVIIDDGKLHNRFFDENKLRQWGRP
jgi:hypothetical protein